MRRLSLLLAFEVVALAAIGLSAPACDEVFPEPHEGASLPAGDTAVDAGDASSVDRCADGAVPDYPAGPYGLELLDVLPPDLAFEGDLDGSGGPVRPRDVYEPCAAKSRLLLIRSTAAWCGSCDWHAKHTRELVDDPRLEGRVLLLDLLVADEDNMPPTKAALERWRAKVTAPSAGMRWALDPAYTMRAADIGFGPLPLYVAVDTRTMRVQTSMSRPNPETFSNQLAAELSDLDGAPRKTWVTAPVFDDRFSQDEWDMIRDMRLVDAPPPDPTNAYADLPAAAELGRALFEDTGLSPSNTVSCATCHVKEKGFADDFAQAHGVAVGDRNTPSITLAAHARWQFWDGRADTLWMQALGPFENDKEFASSRLFVAHRVATHHATAYTDVFGAAYPLPDVSGWPAAGKPGDPAWASLPPADRDAVNRVYANVGKAIAAFERTLRAKPNALDRYAGGDLNALTPDQKASLKTFFDTGCEQCHWGPRLTDDAFHALRFPSGRQDGTGDPGRFDVLATLASAEFVASSTYSDDPSAAKPLAFTPPSSMRGAFKTPTLRGVATTAPFGHGGRFTTLLDVTKHYGQRAMSVTDATGEVEPWVPNFDTMAQARLPAILEVLTLE